MAKIQTLGLPVGPVQRTATAAAPDLAEYGASGTPIFGGFLRERGEYNPELVGLSAIATYEQMRRSDGQVAATLTAMKLPIRSAQWDVVVDDDATPAEQEAADFVRECFFEDLDFSAVLRNALLMLDFGVAVHEDVYEVVGNRVRLKKLAPRLPTTFYRWLTDDTGEDLAALEQLGYRGSEYVTVQVPANKLSVFTFEQEGQNYTGRSLLRPMYMHWYLKQGLYKTDAIACERNGMGVPTIIMGPDAKKEDIAAAKQFVEHLVAHERTGLVLPHEYLFELKGVDGTLRDPKDSIAHHNVMISMAALEMFMTLGQSSSGNRALGDTMADFFYLGLDATAMHIERVLNMTTVKRLVDFNFTGIRKYPRLKCQQILTVKFEGIVSALKELATSGVIQPDDKLEAYMREKMGAPAADPDTARVGKTVTVGSGGASAQAIAGAQNAKSGDSNGAGVSPTLQAMDSGSVHVAGAMGGTKLRREPRGVEKFLAASEIVSALDKARDEVAAALRAAKSRVQAGVVQKLMARPVQQAHQVSLPLDAKLVAEVEAVLRRVFDFGAGQVADERARQLAGKGIETAAKLRAADAKRKSDPIALYAEATVSEFQNDLTARAARVTLDYRRRQADLTDGEVIRAAEEELDGQSDKWMDSVASKGTNEAFADGRADGYEQHADEIGSVVYSALLDINTCPACADADGAEGATPDDIPGVPNPDCDGGDKCRCVHVFVFADEGKAA